MTWLRSEGLVWMHRDGGAAYYEVVEGHPLLKGLRELIESADLLDAAGGKVHDAPAYDGIAHNTVDGGRT